MAPCRVGSRMRERWDAWSGVEGWEMDGKGLQWDCGPFPNSSPLLKAGSATDNACTPQANNLPCTCMVTSSNGTFPFGLQGTY